MNPATQKQALIAGGRTAIQAFQASLVVILGAGGLASVTDIRTVQWVALGSGLLAGLLVAVLAGLNSYLNFTLNGIPAAYSPAVEKPVTPAVTPVSPLQPEVTDTTP